MIKRIKGFTLIELMIVLAMIGVLLAIAIPAYQQYLIKARVMEGIQLAQSAKAAVIEFFLSENRLPDALHSAVYTPIASTENVASIKIGEQGQVIIQYTKAAGDGTLIFEPLIQSAGDLQWRCSGGSLLNQYRPMICR